VVNNNSNRRSIRTFGRLLWVCGQDVVIVISVVLLILFRIPWTSSFLGKFGLEMARQDGLIIVVVLAALYARVSELSKRIRSRYPTRRVLRGPMEVYPILTTLINKTKTSRKKTLQVIGMNLKTAWPSINMLIQNGQLDGWSIEFATYVGSNSAEAASETWANESQKNIDSILRESRSNEAASRQLTLTAYKYNFSPAVHGFRLGNGDLFISTLRRHPCGNLTLRGYTYNYILNSDMSEEAIAARELFESWWKSATGDGRNRVG